MPAPKLSTGPSSEGKTRVQLDLSPATIEQMNRSMDICELGTRKELFNHALSLFDWAVEEVMRGRVIASLDEQNKHYTKMTMPALSAATRFAARQRQAALAQGANGLS